MTYFNRDDRQNDRKSFGPRRDFGGSRGGQDRRMYPAVCDECGRDCQVPFSPDGSKPIYCSNCFEKNQRGSDQGRPSFGGRQFEERKGGQSQTQNNELLVSINAKLGKILDLLNASNKPVQKEVEVEPVKKVKKVAKKK